MRMDLQVDASQLERALANIDLTADDLLQIEGAGAAVVIMNQKIDVPVDLATTRNSIRSHYVTSTRTRVEDDIGPETDYAPYLEYGTGEFATKGGGRKGGWVYKGRHGFRFTYGNRPQPFIVPSATGTKRRDCINTISRTFGMTVVEKWTT